MIALYRQLNTSKAVLLFSLAAATHVAAAASCASPEPSNAFQAGYVNNISDWKEFDAAGKRLVHESGTLRGIEISANLRCANWNLAGQIAQLDGSRSYDGQTSNGTSATSHSDIRQRSGHLQTAFNLTDEWQLGLRISGQTLWRNIASTSTASGYPERYEWTILSLGTQWQSAPASNQFTIGAWYGKQLMSSMYVALPGRDSATLPLGSIRQIELNAAWRTQLTPRWHVQADVRYRRIDMQQGDNVAITSNGIPVGVAHQPRTNMVDIPIVVKLGYTF